MGPDEAVITGVIGPHIQPDIATVAEVRPDAEVGSTVSGIAAPGDVRAARRAPGLGKTVHPRLQSTDGEPDVQVDPPGLAGAPHGAAADFAVPRVKLARIRRRRAVADDAGRRPLARLVAQDARMGGGR